MTSSHRHPINYRALTILLIVTLPALVIAGAVALGIGQAQLRDSYGRVLGRMAQQTASAADAFVFRRLADVSTLAKVPLVRDASETASADPLDVQRLGEIDRVWRRHVGLPPDVRDLLDSPASHFLHDLVSSDAIYDELLVTDRYGRLVAASGVTSDYYQGDERWWRDAADSGRLSVSDVAWDESAQAFAVEVAVPIEAESGGVVGVLKAVVDTRELFAAVTGVYAAGTGEPVLVRRDGTVVFSRVSSDPTAQYFAATLLRDHLQGVQPGDIEYQSYFRAAGADGQPQVVAIAPSQVARSFPQLPWVVAVSESERTLFAPVRAQVTNLLLVLGIVAILFSVMTVWWSARLATLPDADLRKMEMGLERHAHVSGIGQANAEDKVA